MRQFSVLVCTAWILAALFPPATSAQGCGQIPIDEGDVDCCGTYQQPNVSCGGSGNPRDYCYDGYGDCCGLQYYTANVQVESSSCCGWESCPPHYFWSNCQCQYASPIIIDTTGTGFHFTSAEDGVTFDIAGNGNPIRIAWTSANSGDAFLALDRNSDGRINSGKELFGNFTAQPSSGHPNGFLALAEFDKPENGGNNDGIIDYRDQVFSRLVLWIDENHDGISQPNELHSLPELGVFSLGLKYWESRRVDEFGNELHYKAAVNPRVEDGESKDERWAYDVFFNVLDSSGAGVKRQHLNSEVASSACGHDGSTYLWLRPQDSIGTLETLDHQGNLTVRRRRRCSGTPLAKLSSSGGKEMKPPKVAYAAALTAGFLHPPAQQPSNPSGTSTIKVSSEFNEPFTGQLIGGVRCDNDGNIYARLMDSEDSKRDHATSTVPVRTILPDGHLGRAFSIADVSPQLFVTDFFVSGGGTVFQAARSDSEQSVYILSYSKNGTLNSRVKLDAEFFVPYQVAAFRTGEFLVSGIKGYHNRTPYTAVFRPDGKLVKEVHEAEDEDSRRRAEAGERGYSPDYMDYSNDFVTHGDIAIGADGNAYLLRASAPALIYVISSKAMVVRKLHIEAPASGLVGARVKAADKLAIVFVNRSSGDGEIVEADYSGNRLGTVTPTDQKLHPRLLGCYSSKGFTFLGMEEGTGLHLYKSKLE